MRRFWAAAALLALLLAGSLANAWYARTLTGDMGARLDRAQAGAEDYGGILVALSPTRLSDGGGYSALVGVME